MAVVYDSLEPIILYGLCVGAGSRRAPVAVIHITC